MKYVNNTYCSYKGMMILYTSLIQRGYDVL